MQRLSAVCSVLGAVACGADPDEIAGGGGTGNEPTTTVESALNGCDASDVEHYTNHNSPWPLNKDTHYCWMASFVGDGTQTPRQQVWVDSSGFWDASPASVSRPEYSVRCVRLGCFHSDGGSQDVKWVSGNFGTGSEGTSSGCRIGTSQAWLGDAMTALQGWEGGGVTGSTSDYASVIQSNISSASSVLINRDCYWQDSLGRDMEAISLFVGIPGGTHRPVFRGPKSNRAYGPDAAGEYVSKSWDATTSVSMAYVDEGICYFTRLGGNFHTTSDYAVIAPSVSPPNLRWRWKLHTVKSSNNNSTTGIQAHARCYLFDQSQ